MWAKNMWKRIPHPMQKDKILRKGYKIHNLEHLIQLYPKNLNNDSNKKGRTRRMTNLEWPPSCHQNNYHGLIGHARYMATRLSGQTYTFGDVFFVSKTLLGILRQEMTSIKSNFDPKASPEPVLEYWFIARGLFVPQLSEISLFTRASLLSLIFHD